jgi:hypothetical protein
MRAGTGKCFAPLLNWLRTGRLVLGSLDCDAVLAEAAFCARDVSESPISDGGGRGGPLGGLRQYAYLEGASGRDDIGSYGLRTVLACGERKEESLKVYRREVQQELHRMLQDG